MITNYHRQQEAFSLWRDCWRLHREKMLKGNGRNAAKSQWDDLIFRVVLRRIGAPLLLNYTQKEREREAEEKGTRRTPITAWLPRPVDCEHTSSSHPPSLACRLFHPRLCAPGAHTRAATVFSPSEASKRKGGKYVRRLRVFCALWKVRVRIWQSLYYRNIYVIWHGRKCAKSASLPLKSCHL